MPLFVIHARDVADGLALRLATREAHLAHARSIGAALRLAGPLLDSIDGAPVGSLLIIEMPSAEAAAAFAAADPYALAGLFADVTVTPWRQALPVALA